MTTAATTLSDIDATDWSLKLDSIGAVVEGIKDIDQCIILFQGI